MSMMIPMLFRSYLLILDTVFCTLALIAAITKLSSACMIRWITLSEGGAQVSFKPLTNTRNEALFPTCKARMSVMTMSVKRQ